MDTYKNGSFITYGCNVGFTLVNGVQQCMQREWQGEDPQCERSMFNLQASWRINLKVEVAAQNGINFPISQIALKSFQHQVKIQT